MGVIDSIRKHPVRASIATAVIGAGIWYAGCRDSQPSAKQVLNLPVTPGYLSIGGPNDDCRIEQYVVENERQPHLVCQDGTGGVQAWAIPSETPDMLNTYLAIKGEVETARTTAKNGFEAFKQMAGNYVSQGTAGPTE
ncbi:hypothetical protein GOV07_00805 [Candidatus Woesearchaeota archaeon]|nr:hypothetical protein [Candidatus Woesearchaeota archaeon]